MRFFLYAVYIHLKRILFRGYFAVCIISLLLIFAAGSYLSKSQDELTVKIGIIYSSDSEIESDIYKVLSEYPNLDITVYKSETDAQRAVASGKIACAYIFENIKQKIANKDFTEFAVSLQPPYTSAAGVINQLVYSSILKAIAPQISYDYLQNNTDSELTYNEIQKIIEGYFNDGIFVRAEEAAANGGAGISEKSSEIKFLDGSHIIHGIISLVIFLYILLISASQISDKHKNIYFRMAHTSKAINEAAYSTALYLTGVLYIFMCILFVNIIYPEFAYPISQELISGLAFIFCLTAVNALISSVLSRGEQLYVNAAIIFIIVCIFGNTFFDIGTISSTLGSIQNIFPSSHYIWSLKSDTASTFILFASGIIIHAVGFLGRAVRTRL